MAEKHAHAGGPASIPDCLGPREGVARPGLQAPPGAWDTHFHVLGPPEKYPYAADRRYSPPTALLEDYLALLDRLGLDRAIVVHPNTHGFDMSVTIDALARASGRLFGVAKLDGSLTPDAARRLHGLGFRGVRFAFNPQHGGAFDRDAYRRIVSIVSELGWFCELHTAPEAIVEMEQTWRSSPIPLVFDHYGRIDPRLGVDQPAFSCLRRLVEDGRAWVKLSGADRISHQGAPYDDLRPFAAALIDSGPSRLIWGSDWPHTGYFAEDDMPSDTALLDSFADLVPDAAVQKRILVENPNRLVADGGRDG